MQGLPSVLAVLAALHSVISAFLLPSDTASYLRDIGYEVEKHTVETEDGYVLGMFRIPRRGGTPILVMHGILASSDIWVLMQRDQNIVTLLADQGYDIWLANQRGNVYSHKHKFLSSDPSNSTFWDFSGEEIATRDLPALMDHITAVNGRQKMFYLGHSMGGTVWAILCSERPDFCRERLEGAVLLAPVIYPPSSVRLLPLRLMVQWASAISNTFMKAGTYEFLGRDQPFSNYIYNSCRSENSLCTLALQGLDFQQNKHLFRPLADYVASILAGTSVKVYEHLSYCVSRNEPKFGPLPKIWSGTGPTIDKTYDVSNIDHPVAIYYAEDDIFIDQQAIDQLTSQLKNVIVNQRIPAPYKHMGFYYEVDRNSRLVESILKFTNKYNSARKIFQ